jgi:hypothetical protein
VRQLSPSCRASYFSLTSADWPPPRGYVRNGRTSSLRLGYRHRLIIVGVSLRTAAISKGMICESINLQSRDLGLALGPLLADCWEFCGMANCCRGRSRDCS